MVKVMNCNSLENIHSYISSLVYCIITNLPEQLLIYQSIYAKTVKLFHL